MDLFNELKKYIKLNCIKNVTSIKDYKIDFVILNEEFSIRYRPFNDSILVEILYKNWNTVYSISQLKNKFKNIAELWQSLVVYTWYSYVKNIESKGGII